MKNPQDLKGILADTIRDDVGSTRNDHFSGASDPSRPSERGEAAKLFHRALNVGLDSFCRRWIVAGDVIRFGDQFGDGFAQPNAPGVSTS